MALEDQNMELIVGYLAALLVSLLQLPQVYKTYQMKSAAELSFGMIVLNFLASILWLIYGMLLNKPPIYISNVIYFIANCSLLAMKVAFNPKKENSIEKEISGVSPRESKEGA